MPVGRLRIAVPDLEVLCRLFLEKKVLEKKDDVNAQFYVHRMIMGGQIEPFDDHKTGFSQNILIALFCVHGFTDLRRVDDFTPFDDTSKLHWQGTHISLNMQCIRANAR